MIETMMNLVKSPTVTTVDVIAVITLVVILVYLFGGKKTTK